MNKMKQLVMVTSIALGTTFAHGQLLGLPVASDALPNPKGNTVVSGGIVLGDDLNLYGGRFAYSVEEYLTVFGDLGLVDPDHGDTGFGAQGGALFAIALDQQLPFEVALRLTAGYANLDQRYGRTDVDIDIWHANGGAVVSSAINETISVYGYVGLAYIKTSGSARVDGFRASFNDSDVEPALGVGALVALTEAIDLYVEFMHIDDPWFGVGLRYNL